MTKEEALKERIALAEARIRAVPASGREIAPKGKPSCVMCRRAVGPVGRLLYPGAPTCSSADCETCKASDVTGLFETRYGRAVDLYSLRTFLRCLDGPSVHVEKSGLIARAPELGRALVELERWQWAFESWTMVHRPEARELGRAVLIPPKRIDEVVRIRLKGEWSVVDPSRSLEEPVRSQVVSIWDRGPVAEEVPF